MEKITLKPNIKELLYKNGEDNVHFDILSYQGASGQEKMLGSLFVLGHIKYTEENLAYAVSLISSLAKREYYSERSFQEQNAKSAFERTLKKLNEVLDDFFQNKNFKLDIGLAAISGENIFISRLGKFKIALARNGKYIDILNNIELFSKDAEGEKQFSNIISGKIQPNDKIFAYLPFRAITSREKQLNNIFVKENQEEFSQKIAHLAANANNFSCCGVHMDIREIKEIPISPSPSLGSSKLGLGSPAVYAEPILKTRASSKKEILTPRTENLEPRQDLELGNPKPETGLETEQSRIIPAEFLVSKRTNIFTPLVSNLKKLVSIGKLGNRARQRSFIMIAAIVLVPILIIILLKTGGDSGANKNTLKQAGENFKLAQSHITQSNLKDARSLLQASLTSLTGFSGKKAENTKQQINQTLDGLDSVSDKQPALFTDPMIQNKDFKANLIATFSDRVNTADINGVAFTITLGQSYAGLAQSEISQLGQSSNVYSYALLGQFKTTPQFIFSASALVSVFNGSDTFGVYNLESKKISTYSLKEPTPVADAVLYENNLYTLSGNTIYKYADATTGGTKRATWISNDSNGNLMSITADGNIYALTSDGKLIKYFKGKKTGESDLQLVPSSGSRIFTFRDLAFIYLADKTNKKVYIFDKANGSLKTTYKLDAASTISDISISPNGTVWILSSDNKVWVIK